MIGIEVRQTEAFARWFEQLRDRQARARTLVRIRRVSLGNLGDVRPVGPRSAGGVMAKPRTRTWDAAEHLQSRNDMATYLEAALDEGDAALVAATLGDIARASGMTAIARETGLGRESLYKALSPEGNPEFATVLKVLQSLGLKLHASAA